MTDETHVPSEPDTTSPPGGCLAHGVAWLLLSAAMLLVMLAITAGCYGLYRLVGGA